MATYHRASKKQHEYITRLAEETSTTLPWGWEGYSASRAAKLIEQLKRSLPSPTKPEAETGEEPGQTTLFGE